ncbi:MAG: carboxylesterase family protein, partial [Acidimicrobiales bacterium]
MASTSKPVARTTSGAIAGREHHGVIQFAGVPYAAAPVGPRRFRAPEPIEPWSGTRDATAFGPVSWQATGSMASLLGSAELHLDEDCLTLNVQTPALDDRGRPVMVWIHGGGFDSGSGSTPWYDGSSFVARRDVVVVSLNYRLGALGFLHLGGPHGLGAEYASSGL